MSRNVLNVRKNIYFSILNLWIEIGWDPGRKHFREFKWSKKFFEKM